MPENQWKPGKKRDVMFEARERGGKLGRLERRMAVK